ncbi:GyrI-like domain-containing protein [Lentisphaerota bacterium ZTH]|nr:GyrI-like domain-containing protein [Lentisphaerota bacterium]WET05448.1 GyrI-like domain-containing protein [Lentisphaerota bacterium ZTH]
MDIPIKKLPDLRVAYVSRFGAYGPEISQSFEKLMIWAKGHIKLDGSHLRMTAYWHDPYSTPPEDCRSDACICIPDNVTPAPDSGIEVQVLPSRMYAMGLFNVFNDNFDPAWDIMFSEWLPTSGCIMDLPPCLEIYYNCALTHPLKKWVVDICIPVKKVADADTY